MRKEMIRLGRFVRDSVDTSIPSNFIDVTSPLELLTKIAIASGANHVFRAVLTSKDQASVSVDNE